MDGFVTAATTAVAPLMPTRACSDKVTAEGQSGWNPPEICLTNTGYHSKSCLCSLVCLYMDYI